MYLEVTDGIRDSRFINGLNLLLVAMATKEARTILDCVDAVTICFRVCGFTVTSGSNKYTILQFEGFCTKYELYKDSEASKFVKLILEATLPLGSSKMVQFIFKDKVISLKHLIVQKPITLSAMLKISRHMIIIYRSTFKMSQYCALKKDTK